MEMTDVCQATYCIAASLHYCRYPQIFLLLDSYKQYAFFHLYCLSVYYLFFDLSPNTKPRGFSSVGRASALHAEGQGFDSPNLHLLPFSFAELELNRTSVGWWSWWYLIPFLEQSAVTHPFWRSLILMANISTKKIIPLTATKQQLSWR